MQEKLNKAWELKKKGHYIEALDLYQQVHDYLVDEAREYAQSLPGTRIDEGNTLKIMPLFFTEAQNYLRKDKLFCTILNNMGVIYAELGKDDSAERCFEDAISFIPEGVDYPDPKINYQNLKNPNL